METMLIEDNIAEKIRGGDRGAFERLFRSMYRELCIHADKFVPESDQAEEIVQEMFFSIWSKREGLNVTTSIRSYMYRAVRNSCLNYIKHLKVKDSYQKYNKEVISQSETDAGDSMVATELEEKINDSIASLPKERQRIFRMNRHDGLKYREIADKLGLSVKTVEAQMGKALKFLRSQLTEYLPFIIIFLKTIMFFSKNE